MPMRAAAKPGDGTCRVKRDAHAHASRSSRVFDDNFQVYGVRKVWRQLQREGLRRGPLHGGAADEENGSARGDPRQAGAHDGERQDTPLPARSRQSAVPGTTAEHAVGLGLHLRRDLDRLRLRGLRHRRLRPPHRRLARVSRSAHAGFVLDALEQALHDRKPVSGGGLVHHSDRGVQYVSIKYTERLAEAGLVPSVGSVGDSYDNALAETINGLYKAEVIHRRGPWRSLEAVEYATLEWVDASSTSCSSASRRLSKKLSKLSDRRASGSI